MNLPDDLQFVICEFSEETAPWRRIFFVFSRETFSGACLADKLSYSGDANVDNQSKRDGLSRTDTGSMLFADRLDWYSQPDCVDLDVRNQQALLDLIQKPIAS